MERMIKSENGQTEILRSEGGMENHLKDEVYVAGFRLNYRSVEPEFYVLIVYEGEEAVVTFDESLPFVTESSKIQKLFEFLDDVRKEKYLIPTSVESSIDLAGALYLLENENEDDQAVVLDALNMTFDLLKAIEVTLDGSREEVLSALADHLTFSKNLGEFFEFNCLDRMIVIDHFLWCLGKIVSRSMIVN